MIDEALRDLLPDLPDCPAEADPFLDALSLLDPVSATPGRYPADPLAFIREVLGEDLWDGQERIVRAVWAHRYTSVASCHGVGKTRVLADIAITYLHLHPNSIVLTTAPTGRQVEHVLWREIRAAYRRARQPLLGRPPLTTRYEIGDLWYAIGFKPNDAEADPAQGFHAENVLVIIDEAAGVPTPLIDGLSAALTTEGSRLLMTGNPTSTSGPFYDSHHGAAALYERIVIRWGDTPNARAGRTVRPYLITRMWVDEAIQKYGADSAFVRSRVEAAFVSAEDVLIPLSQIEAAAERGEEEVPAAPPYEAGLDVSRGGGDRTVLVVRAGGRILGVEEHRGGTAYEVTGWVLATIGRSYPGVSLLKVDRVGIGEGVVDVLTRTASERGLALRVAGVNFGAKASDPEQYRNQRCEAYGRLADRFRAGDIAGPLPAGAVGDLSDLRYAYDGRHTQPVIEAKDDFKQRTGHSPDHGDAVALAFYRPPEEPRPMGALVFGSVKITRPDHRLPF